MPSLIFALNPIYCLRFQNLRRRLETALRSNVLLVGNKSLKNGFGEGLTSHIRLVFNALEILILEKKN